MRAGGGGVRRSLPRLFREWEQWAADILESHLSYPLLAFFRSPHDNTSWVTSLGAVLDAATLVLSSVDDQECSEDARMLYETGTHAIEDLFYYFRLPERPGVIERGEFDQVLEDLRTAGVPLRNPGDAWIAFGELRAVYGARLNALASRMTVPAALWIGDRSTVREAPTERLHA